MKRSLQVLGAGAALATVVGLGVAPATALAPASTTTFRGEVTARSLSARGTPSTHTQRLYSIPRGERVDINCKVRGTNVDGNRLWYLLASHDGTEWVSARHVRNLGAAPDYCDPSDGSFVGRTTARLNQRAGASPDDRVLGRFERGAAVRAVCYTLTAPDVRWVHTARGRWVSGAYLRVSPNLRYCLN